MYALMPPVTTCAGLTSAPLFSSWCTTATWPCMTAFARGVAPPWLNRDGVQCDVMSFDDLLRDRMWLELRAASICLDVMSNDVRLDGMSCHLERPCKHITAATTRTLELSTLSCLLTSAPPSSNKVTNAAWPWVTAQSRGVWLP
jgi:hypothetical protein